MLLAAERITHASENFVDNAALYERLLVVRCQSGDALAFGELVERYSLRLRYFLRKLIGADAAVDDLLQDVWLAAFRGLPKLVELDAFRPWLYRIARDRAYGVLRHQQRVPKTSRDVDISTIADDAEPEISADDIVAVHRALDTLPAEQREAVVLRFIEQMSYEDIARVAGVPVGTIRSRLYYGKQALRAQLHGD